MSSPEPPGGRPPIGESPRWIAVHMFVALGWVIVIAVLVRLLPDGQHGWLGVLLTTGALLVLVNMALLYKARCAMLDKVGTGYLRTAIVLIAVLSISGTWHLSIPAGIAFYIWTIVERRRQRKPPTRKSVV